MNDRRREAFEALRHVAEEFAARGRKCVAASAKPAFVARVGFDESAIGYPTFRAMLADAERGGWVTLSYVPSGDVRISPPTDAPAAGPTTRTMKPAAQMPPVGRQRPLPLGTKIRHDFWNAVIKDTETWLFDQAADAVVTGASEQREGMVPLPTADVSVQNAWIQEFLETLDEPRRSAVGAAVLQVDEPRAKHEVLVSQPAPVRNAWYAWRTRMVLSRLEKWKEEHGLNNVELFFVSPVSRPPRSARTGRAGGTAPATSDRQLRDRVHRAIEHMPTSELLRLPIPIEFLLDV